jgi:hypothetical protein
MGFRLDRELFACRELDLITARLVSCFIAAGILAGVGHAQDSLSQNSAPNSGSSASTSEKADAARSDQVILKVGDVQVTRAEFESRISEIEPGADPDKGPSDKDRRKLGDDYASVLMLSQQAAANHLESSPEVSRQLAVARMQVLSDAEFANLMRQADPTTEEISKYYSDHLSDYDVTRIRRLFVWKRRGNVKDAPVLSSQAAKARGDQIVKEYAAGTSATKLAGDLRKSGDGMLDPEPLSFPRGDLSPRMEKVASGLKENEWSEVEDTPAAVLFIQLVKRDRRQLGQVSSTIEKELQGDKMQALLDDLKKKAGVWMDEEYFGTAVAPVPGAQRRTSDPPSELQKSAKKGESNNENETQK